MVRSQFVISVGKRVILNQYVQRTKKWKWLLKLMNRSSRVIVTGSDQTLVYKPFVLSNIICADDILFAVCMEMRNLNSSGKSLKSPRQRGQKEFQCRFLVTLLQSFSCRKVSFLHQHRAVQQLNVVLNNTATAQNYLLPKCKLAVRFLCHYVEFLHALHVGIGANTC